jgi:hypothetical protein
MKTIRFTGEISLNILQNLLKRDFHRPLSSASSISRKFVLSMSVREKKEEIDQITRRLW